MIRQGRCYLVAEIGINHNGEVEIAEKLIEGAVEAGCDAVKFQKRTPDICVPAEQRDLMRETPWGVMSYMDYRHRMEFGTEEFDRIDAYCRAKGIEWLASFWDEPSLEFLLKYDTPYLKVPSAVVTDRGLLTAAARSGRPLLVSSGMCDLAAIRKVVEAISGAGGEIACLYHCTSTYPAAVEELNLTAIQTLAQEFPGVPIGYSGHETGVPTSVMAAVLGAASVERHVTLNRAMWGSDHAASLEMPGLKRLARDIRVWERARGDGVVRFYESEKPVAARLRRVDDL